MGARMKAGIRRIKPREPQHCVEPARCALAYLQTALDYARDAGACYTAARIRHAISSAKGAVRAAQYRQRRGVA